MTSQSRSSSGSRSSSSRSTTALPFRSGAAVSGRTSFDPAIVSRNASITEIQNRCGSRSWRWTWAQAALSTRPASAIQDRRSIVFPLPAGADIWVTRSASSRRPISARRIRIPRAAGAAGSSAIPYLAADSMRFPRSAGSYGVLLTIP